jgi:hypothetical protein
MKRNLDEIRQKNLAGKRDIHNKPPSAFKRPAFNKVDERYRSAYDEQVILAQKEKDVTINNIFIEKNRQLFVF